VKRRRLHERLRSLLRNDRTTTADFRSLEARRSAGAREDAVRLLRQRRAGGGCGGFVDEGC
jgi:hypothetical protein